MSQFALIWQLITQALASCVDVEKCAHNHYANLGAFGKSTENSFLDYISHGTVTEQYPFSLIKLKSYFSVN